MRIVKDNQTSIELPETLSELDARIAHLSVKLRIDANNGEISLSEQTELRELRARRKVLHG